MSVRIAESEHRSVLEAFERHAAAGYGEPTTIEGCPLTESSFDSPLGKILLVTSRELGETYVYYDWEETS